LKERFALNVADGNRSTRFIVTGLTVNPKEADTAAARAVTMRAESSLESITEQAITQFPTLPQAASHALALAPE
jgi:hypothetical protein